MKLYVLLGQSASGDDALESIGCTVHATLEAAKQTATENQAKCSDGDELEPLDWTDGPHLSWVHANGEFLEIRYVNMEDQ